MKVLVIGSGGREHAIVWKLKQSSRVSEIYCAPGNPGTAQIAKNVSIKVDQLTSLADFAQREAIDLTIVGPEYPLSLGVVDLFEQRDLKIFGPSRAAAQLESSKAFAKEVMLAAGVPTAHYERVVGRKALEEVCRRRGAPLVLKADGLAAGKGVCVCLSADQIQPAIEQICGELKAEVVVVEECLQGPEVSFIVATNGREIVAFKPAHDYKRIFDNDQGPNTGGMGTVCPTPRLTHGQENGLVDSIIRPVLNEMAKRGIPFAGFLYAGLMLTKDGPKVIEFNARMGDPECQSILSQLDSDLFELIWSLLDGKISPRALSWKTGASVCVAIAAAGYPTSVRTGDIISGLDSCAQLAEVNIFHAGTTLDDNKIVTSGGRVLSVVAHGQDIDQARQRAYQACEKINFNGKQFRKDIGQEAA